MMYKLILLLSLALLSILPPGPGPQPSDRESRSATAHPEATPTPAAPVDVSVELDRDAVCRPCPPGVGAEDYDQTQCSDDKMLISITASVGTGRDTAERSWYYTVSGGRVVGEGASVTWDLSDERPGTYTITVAAADKKKLQTSTATRKIIVLNSICEGFCVCPTVSVSAPGSPTRAGEDVIFTADVSGADQSQSTYKWAVSGGEIIAGQGTPEIKARTRPEMAGSVIKAVVEVEGKIFRLCDCPGNASATSPVVTPE